MKGTGQKMCTKYTHHILHIQWFITHIVLIVLLPYTQVCIHSKCHLKQRMLQIKNNTKLIGDL